ncbi:hypothetical protein [Thermococcus aciditolerans]|uniref:Uncharacterized protein n=1 Tax=Thermococcus aciditolerans TaxID=2598455 RepID=A0A5C0SLZ6_9EURY|nr:hypothetical protein [Thermococcus aciditolerans]QEK14756.1 hypothetical protein FPV09_06210 [Thermococcus aciditolerans]
MSILVKGVGGKRQLAHGFAFGTEVAIIGGGVILNKTPSGSLNAGVSIGVAIVGIATTPTIQ